MPRGEISIFPMRLIFGAVFYLRGRLPQCFSRGWDNRGIYAGKRICVSSCHTGRRVAFFIGHSCSLLTVSHAAWRRPKLCDWAISRKPVLPKLLGNFHQPPAQAVTTKELGATIGAGGYKPLKHRGALCATRRMPYLLSPHFCLRFSRSVS